MFCDRNYERPCMFIQFKLSLVSQLSLSCLSGLSKLLQSSQLSYSKLPISLSCLIHFIILRACFIKSSELKILRLVKVYCPDKICSQGTVHAETPASAAVLGVSQATFSFQPVQELAKSTDFEKR